MAMSASLRAITNRPPFDAVYGEFLPRITGFLRAKLCDPTDADDVAAEVFARAFQAYGRYEPRCGTPAAWLFRIARNAAFDHQRRARQRERAENAAVDAWRELEDPTQLAEQRFWYRELRYAIARLPQRQREVISLRHAGGLSFKEIGQRFGCTEDAAKMLYHRGLRALRPLVTEGMAA
jgi:RNA polymerase sigma-70 factor (ECF subfamily)